MVTPRNFPSSKGVQNVSRGHHVSHSPVDLASPASKEGGALRTSVVSAGQWRKPRPFNFPQKGVARVINEIAETGVTHGIGGIHEVCESMDVMDYMDFMDFMEFIHFMDSMEIIDVIDFMDFIDFKDLMEFMEIHDLNEIIECFKT